ncbi:MAG: response regulator [Bryobacteraceae bacterium]
MQKQTNKRVLAVVEDLFFSVKIADAAKRAGLETDFVKSEKDALAKAKDNPLLIILDLNCGALQPLNLISKLKANAEMKEISLLGFVSHVQGDLKQKAHENGCDVVMARSAFSQNLPQILKRHAGAV